MISYLYAHPRIILNFKIDRIFFQLGKDWLMLKIHYFKPYCAGSKFHRKTLKFHSLLNKIDLNPQKKKLDRLAKKKTP